ncbi:MAG: GerW family sporulation protein [Oscillospiraceae bacterium]|nr:GerW family sporulation protein [Oscillospiraceae bacterium]
MAEHLEGLMQTSMEKIRELVDVNTIIGDPVTSPDGTVIIPISKVSFGFVSGGSDIPASVPREVFAGGSGAGVTIKPQAFIVVKRDGGVELLELGAKSSPVDGLIEGIPGLVAKVKDLFGKKGEDDEEEENEEEEK